MAAMDGNASIATGRRARAMDVWAWLTLALATLVVLWPLGLTNRILAGIDAFTYFTPYWAYRIAELRAGHLPLWNPYLFLGVPFLANPQAAVLYPLHWPLTWLSAERALIWSALLHIWLAAGLAYTYARRSLQLSVPAAWLAGALFGLGGFVLARVENINQLNALAWLPGMLWTYDEVVRAETWRKRVRWGLALTAVVALQLLAGHTQTSYVNLLGLALYAAWPVLADIVRGVRRAGPRLTIRSNRELWPLARLAWARVLPLAAMLVAAPLCAAQLLPSLELNELGLRTGGLPFRQAVSFSLRPRLMAQTFLPPFGRTLAEGYGSEGYAEFVAYAGVAGLALALMGVLSLRQGPHVNNSIAVRRQNQAALICLAAVALALALGAYNPLYYVLWKVVPGFAAFRAPVRWLALYAIGVAGLAGTGFQAFLDGSALSPMGRLPWRRAGTVLLLVVGLALAAYQQWPRWPVVALWAAAGAVSAGLWWLRRRQVAAAQWGLLGLVMLELWASSRALPYSEATAPSALALRGAPAALLAATADQPAAGRTRFLSLSDIRFDPGDLKELRALQGNRLAAEPIERLVRAAKQVEVLTPNLSLGLGLPAVDGYDGGLLPTDRYVKFLVLFFPPGQYLTDGRLREQLTQIPRDTALDLVAARFVITDKQNDLWADDVYYDLELPDTLAPGGEVVLDLVGYPAFEATAVGLVSALGGPATKGTEQAEITLVDAEGRSERWPVRAGHETAAAQGPAGSARVARARPDSAGQTGSDYLALLPLARPITPVIVRVHSVAGAEAALTVQGISLIDSRTGAHMALTVSPRGDYRRIHSGDVKVYERGATLGRAWLVHGRQYVADQAAALAALQEPLFDPAQSVVLVGEGESTQPSGAAVGEGVQIIGWAAERIALRVTASSSGVLVLADTDYPSWQAEVDGQPVVIMAANMVARGVLVEAGVQDVVFTYRPGAWRTGVLISLGTLLLMAIAMASTLAGTPPPAPPRSGAGKYTVCTGKYTRFYEHLRMHAVQVSCKGSRIPDSPFPLREGGQGG